MRSHSKLSQQREFVPDIVPPTFLPENVLKFHPLCQTDADGTDTTTTTTSPTKLSL